MPLPSLSAAIAAQHQDTDNDKTALYPRQSKVEKSLEDEAEDDASKNRPKRLAPAGLFDLLKADGANEGQSKMIGSSAFAAALNSPEKPAANMGDMLSYWQNVAKASKAEHESMSFRLNAVLKSVQMEGFKQASKATTTRAKIFWMLMLIFILFVLSFEIYKCVHAYNNSPVTTKFTISTPPQMDFPKVYVCYGSAINRTYMQLHKDLMQVAIAYRNRNAVTKKTTQRRKREAHELDDEEIIDLLRMQSERDESSMLRDDPEDEADDGLHAVEMDPDGWRRLRRDVSVVGGANGGMNKTMEDALNAALEANRTRAEQATQLAAAKARIESMLQSPNISDVIYQYYREAGFNIEDTFLECSFNGYTHEKVDCRSIVKPVVDANYFLCYVVDLPDDIKQTVAGRGLNLVLNSHVNLYPRSLEEKPTLYAGVVVTVDKEYNPFNWEKTCVAPGQLAKVDLALTHVHLENFDSGPLIQHCYSDDDAKNLFQIFNANYSRTTCQMDCLFQSHRNNCDCIMLVDRSQIKTEVMAKTGFCNPKQFTECVGSLPDNDEVQKAVNACVSQCHHPCESYRYDMRTTVAKLHEPSYARFDLPENVTAKQLIDLRIAFRRLEYEELIQKPSASFADLVANLGGQVNLWMGASLISMIEMTFMAVGFLIWSTYMKCFKKGKQGGGGFGNGQQQGMGGGK